MKLIRFNSILNESHVNDLDAAIYLYSVNKLKRLTKPNEYSSCIHVFYECCSLFSHITNVRSTLIFRFFSSQFNWFGVSAAIRFTIEPSNIVVSEGSSILLPCEGEITHTNADHVLSKRKFNKNRLDLLPNIRWRGPDGQDIGIVGDTFR